jgi:hypothetical protein
VATELERMDERRRRPSVMTCTSAPHRKA